MRRQPGPSGKDESRRSVAPAFYGYVYLLREVSLHLPSWPVTHNPPALTLPSAGVTRVPYPPSPLFAYASVCTECAELQVFQC